MTEEKKKRVGKRQVPSAIYLGEKEKRKEREAKLDAIAASFEVNRSKLIQMIAEGELKVVKAE